MNRYTCKPSVQDTLVMTWIIRELQIWGFIKPEQPKRWPNTWDKPTLQTLHAQRLWPRQWSVYPFKQS